MNDAESPGSFLKRQQLWSEDYHNSIPLTVASKMWLTPRAITGGAESAERKRELGRTASGGGDLQSATQMWPTATLMDLESSGSRNCEGSKAHSGTSLTDAATTGNAYGRGKRWPTASANDYKGTARPGQRRGQLDEAAEQLFQSGHPTETTTKDGPESSTDTHSSPQPCRLNPYFVLWLMGFPLNWMSTGWTPSGD